MNFIKKIIEGEIDEEVHQQFIRFGKGEYKGRFILNLLKSKKIKVKSSFEFANDFVKLCAGFENCEGSGIVLSKKDISSTMKNKNIQGNSETKKGGLFYKNNILKQELGKEQLIELKKESYFTLLNLEGKNFKLKIKSKLPKPGKNEEKIDDKFCQLEADLKFYPKIKENFFWDIADTKKINVKHDVIVDKIIMPESEKDYSKIREMAKRKGKIIRRISIDGKEDKKEIEFEA